MTDEPNYFGELIGILHDEDLIRLERRAHNAGKPRLAEILRDELEEREGIARDAARD